MRWQIIYVMAAERAAAARESRAVPASSRPRTFPRQAERIIAATGTPKSTAAALTGAPSTGSAFTEVPGRAFERRAGGQRARTTVESLPERLHAKAMEQ